jgi:hypothetical protein
MAITTASADADTIEAHLNELDGQIRVALGVFLRYRAYRTKMLASSDPATVAAINANAASMDAIGVKLKEAMTAKMTHHATVKSAATANGIIAYSGT